MDDATAELVKLMGPPETWAEKISQLEWTHHVRTLECSFYEFVKAAYNVIEPNTFKSNWHIRFICDHLQALVESDDDPSKWLGPKNVITMLPPGGMKSLIFSVFFPCFVWTQKPETRWMFCSYSYAYAMRDSDKRRKLILSDWYQKRWGNTVQVRRDKNKITLFENTKGGLMFVTSVGGGMGHHVNYYVIDDPINTKGIHSQTILESVNMWFDESIRMRGHLIEAKRFVVMQRLSEDDLAGHLLAVDGENWTKLVFPMWYESVDPLTHEKRMPDTPLGQNDPRTIDGEPLWVGGFPDKAMKMFAAMPPHIQSGQLQQRPKALEGGMFKREWFNNLQRISWLGRPDEEAAMTLLRDA